MVFPVSFSKFHFLTVCLSPVLTQSLTWVCVCQLWQTQRYIASISLPGRTCCSAVGNVVSKEPEAVRFFRICLSCRESLHLRSCPLGSLPITFGDWIRPLGTAQDGLWKAILPLELYSAQSFTFLSYRSVPNKQPNSILPPASRKPSLQASFCQCPSAQPGPMTWMLASDWTSLISASSLAFTANTPLSRVPKTFWPDPISHFTSFFRLMLAEMINADSSSGFIIVVNNHFLSFYFEIIVDLHALLRNTTERFQVPYSQFPLMVTSSSCITRVQYHNQ